MGTDSTASVVRGEPGVVNGLVQVSFVVQRLLAEVGAPHDLSVIQVRLLGVLRDRQPTMAELAVLLQLGRPGVSGLVDRAEERGLVTRVGDDSDRRSTRVHLTDHGQQLASAVRDEAARRIDALTASLPAHDRQHLARITAHLQRASTRQRHSQ